MSRLGLACFVAILALALGLIPGASGQGGAPPAARAADLQLTGSGGDAVVEYPFRLATDGSVYAKLLPTPWNPALPGGQPNGSVAEDRSAGERGWWVRLAVVSQSGAVTDLGAYADGGASPRVPLAADMQHSLRATIHAPAAAGAAGSAYRVDFALAHQDGGDGAVDATWGLRADLTVTQAAGPTLTIPPMLVLYALAGAVALGAAVIAARRVRSRRSQEWL